MPRRNNMNPAIFIAIFLPLWLLIITHQRQKKKVIATLIKKRREKKENNKMQEIAKRFIEKECLVYLYDGNQITGTIKEITDSAALVEKKGVLEAVNLDYVTRIREYPTDKNGKKKSVVLD